MNLFPENAYFVRWSKARDKELLSLNFLISVLNNLGFNSVIER